MLKWVVIKEAFMQEQVLNFLKKVTEATVDQLSDLASEYIRLLWVSEGFRVLSNLFFLGLVGFTVYKIAKLALDYSAFKNENDEKSHKSNIMFVGIMKSLLITIIVGIFVAQISEPVSKIIKFSVAPKITLIQEVKKFIKE